MTGIIYLIPNSLGNPDTEQFLPRYCAAVAKEVKYLIVENIRNARRYLKSIDRDINIDDLTFFELNKHTKPEDIESFLHPALEGSDTGILSEAGLPGIADPGARIVEMAHRKGIRVVPLTGPSSLFLALMASGFNGQSFRFCGYLPVKGNERIQSIRQLEKKARTEDESQLFIETPYRNMAMLEDILTTCNEDTGLCIAADITTENEFIKTRTVAGWKKQKPELNKRPVVFILGRL